MESHSPEHLQKWGKYQIFTETRPNVSKYADECIYMNTHILKPACIMALTYFIQNNESSELWYNTDQWPFHDNWHKNA